MLRNGGGDCRRHEVARSIAFVGNVESLGRLFGTRARRQGKLLHLPIQNPELHDGQRVIVKIVRPDIEAQIRKDIEVMMLLARMAERYWDEASRIKPLQVVREFETTIMNELDLMREAANASELRRHFEGSPDLYVPFVHWDFCRQRVLVMERISGIPVSDLDRLRENDTNLESLSRKGVEIFFTQVFRHNYFHVLALRPAPEFFARRACLQCLMRIL